MVDEKLQPRKRFLQRFSPILFYFKNVANDYATVFRELGTSARRRPAAAAIWTSTLAASAYVYRTNPTYLDFETRLIELRQQLLMVPEPIQNPRAKRCLEHYTELINTHRLVCYDCLFFTLILALPHDERCNLYAVQDANLRDWPWRELWRNAIDVGALRRFYRLEREFVDYDINEAELAVLPDTPRQRHWNIFADGLLTWKWRKDAIYN